MKYIVILKHNNPAQPDIVIDRQGWTVRNGKEEKCSLIEIDAPGLSPVPKQYLSLYEILKGYHEVTYSGDAVIFSAPMQAMKMLERPTTP